MDPLLVNAAKSRDLGFLRKAVRDCQAKNDFSYFLKSFTPQQCMTFEQMKDTGVGNLLFLVALKDQVEFCREAMASLPTKVVLQLLFEKYNSYYSYTPLHAAASMGHLGIVKLILEYYYKSEKNTNNNYPPPGKPWLSLDRHGYTPLHTALRYGKKECASELLSLNHIESVFTVEDNKYGYGPLMLAVEKGLTQAALKILNSGHPYSIGNNADSSPLRYVPHCSEEVCRLLLERNPELLKLKDKSGSTVMHTWVTMSEVWPFEYLVMSKNVRPEWTSDFMDLIVVAEDRRGENPLHVAVMRNKLKIVQILVNGYRQERAKRAQGVSRSSLQDPLPWLRPDRKGQTPLDYAKSDELRQEFVSCFLSPEGKEQFVSDKTGPRTTDSGKNNNPDASSSNKEDQKEKHAHGGINTDPRTTDLRKNVEVLPNASSYKGEILSPVLPAIQLLDGTNYKKWKRDILFALTFLDIDICLRKSFPLLFSTSGKSYDPSSANIVPIEPDEESSDRYKAQYDKWEPSNRKCLAFMMSMVSDEYINHVYEFKTAKGLLDGLDDEFDL